MTGVHNMTKEDYKEAIVEMLEEIEDAKQIERIYKLSRFIYLYKSDIQQARKPSKSASDCRQN